MADIIDYKIFKSTMDLLGITLDPGEAIVHETGAMLMMEDGIVMDAMIGDGSKKERNIFSKIIGSGKRAITGEGFFMTKLENKSEERRNVIISPGVANSQVIPIDLEKLNSPLLVNKGNFLAVARGIQVNLGIRFKPIASMLGSGELLMHKLTGNGYAFLKSNGPVFTRMLKEGETIRVDDSALAGMSETVKYSVKIVKGAKRILFAGEGLVLYELKGPGLVILQGNNDLNLEPVMNRIEELYKRRERTNRKDY